MKIPHKILNEIKHAFARIIQPHPIKELGCLCFTLGEQGCRIRAANFEESLSWQEGCLGDTDRSFLIDFKHFKSLTEAMQKDMTLEIELRTDEVILIARYTHGGGVPIRLPIQTAEAFPMEPAPCQELQNIPLQELLPAFQQSAFACAKHGDTSVLSGVLLKSAEGLLVATDGKRLLLRKIKPQPQVPPMILPVTGTLKSKLFLGETGKLGTDGRFAFFAQGPWQYRLKLHEGKFPRYEQVIPSNCAHRLDLSPIGTSALRESLKRLFLLDADEGDVEVALFRGQFWLLAKGPTGTRHQALGEVAADPEEEFFLCIDRHFLADGLEACGESLFLRCGDDRSAVLIEGRASGTRYLLMPKHGGTQEGRAYLQKLLAPCATEVIPNPNQQAEEKAMSTTKDPEIPAVSVKVESEESHENPVQKDGLEAIYDKIEKLIEKQQEARKGLVEAHRAVHSTEFQLKLLIKDLKAYERGQNRRLKEVRKVEELISSLHKAA